MCIVERCSEHRAEIGGKVRRGDRRDEGGYVGEGAIEGGNRGVIEIIARCNGLDLVQRGVACADYSDSAGGELVGGVDGGEPAADLSRVLLAMKLY